ncbi:MAG: dephospho-CoA kinase [Tannerella sp.]|jgi:dephospho-CoA kinase|nr:dephospho-CoA kinase [Tannerella sp.]
MNRTRKIGITGGIGSGKSVVATLLETMGLPLYKADDEAKRLYETDDEVRSRMASLFGKEIYRGGHINRRLLASLIFGNPDLLARVNRIIHPAVKRDFEAWSKRLDGICLFESAILYESGFDKQVDLVLMVYAPLELRLQRVMARDGLPREAVENRILNQMDDEEKCRRADYLIYNDDRQALLPQTEKFLASIS